MNTQHTTHTLPSGLLIERYDNGETHYYLISKGWDDWNRGIRYVITEREYNALLPLANEGLLPCPFCGSEDVKEFTPSAYEIGDGAEVRCQNPLCEAGVHGNTIKVARAKWNRRASE